MAKSTPGTAGSKGGGNVVPPRQPTRGGRFGTLGGPGYGPNPLGSAGPRGIVAGDYTYGKGLPRRVPSPQPRYPMPRNPYSQPPNRYGGMQGPTGLGDFLSNQPAISQRQIDPATGFPVQTGSGKGGSKGGAKTVRSPDRGRESLSNRQPQPDIGTTAKSIFDRDPYGTQSYKIDPDILGRGTIYRPPNQISSDRPMMSENPSSSPPPSIKKLQNMMLFGNNPPPSPLQQSFNSEMNSPQYQSALQRYEQSRGQDQDALSQLQASQQKMQGMQDTMGRFGNNPPPRLTQGLPEMPMLFGNNPPPRLTQGLPERPRLTQGQPTPDVSFVPLRQLAVSGDSNNAQSSSLGRFQSQGPESLMRMGRAPNIRPVTNVGKATGGPVGLASLIGQY